MRYFLLSLSLFFISCSSAFPNKARDLSEFIPKNTTQPSLSIGDSVGKFDFLSENFPDKCDWRMLNRVVDGDTIIVGEKLRVRFIGIDTPETKHPKKPIEKGGLEATAYVKQLLKNAQEVCLIGDVEGDSYDRYGRKLAYIFLKNGLDVNAELLKVGLARGYFNFSFSRELEFRFYEQQAQDLQLGLWR